jgi:hypothetical protein
MGRKDWNLSEKEANEHLLMGGRGKGEGREEKGDRRRERGEDRGGGGGG